MPDTAAQRRAPGASLYVLHSAGWVAHDGRRLRLQDKMREEAKEAEQRLAEAREQEKLLNAQQREKVVETRMNARAAKERTQGERCLSPLSLHSSLRRPPACLAPPACTLHVRSARLRALRLGSFLLAHAGQRAFLGPKDALFPMRCASHGVSGSLMSEARLVAGGRARRS